MKVMAKPVDMVAWFDREGTPHPVRFRMDTEEEEQLVVKVDRVITRDLEKLAGNPMIVLKCQSVIRNVEKTYEIKYELGTCRWILFKI